MLTNRDYQAALDVQSACNLSGLIASWTAIVGRIWGEARTIDEGTDWVNRHPINRLFAEQAAHLTGSGTTRNSESYYKAYNECVDKAKRGEPGS